MAVAAALLALPHGATGLGIDVSDIVQQRQRDCCEDLQKDWTDKNGDTCYDYEVNSRNALMRSSTNIICRALRLVRVVSFHFIRLDKICVGECTIK